jgi:glutamate racemase
MKIGFFDSGIGGLTVLKEALRMLPGENYIYFADTANVPYGTKTREEVRRYIFDGVKRIAEYDVDALVVACNTATSIAIADLREIYSFHVLGMEPAVKPAIANSAGKRVLVLATPLTLKEEKFHHLVCMLDSEQIVDSLPLPELVDFAERFIFDKHMIIPYLKEKLSFIDTCKYGTVVLGCTHFPFYTSFLKELFPQDTEIIDGSAGTVRHLKNVLYKNKEPVGRPGRNVTFICSGLEKADNARFLGYLNLLD